MKRAVGSAVHKELFCRDFIASHQAYELEQLPWPDLEGADLQRLRAVSFWKEVLHTERATRAKVNAYAATIQNPLIREAINLQGAEKARHARMIQYYSINEAPCRYNISGADRQASS